MSRRPPRPFRRWGISFVVIGLLFVALLAGVSMWFQNFLRSEAFRRLISEKTGAALRAEANYGPLQWIGSSVHSDALNATGLPDSPLESLRANQVRADINWRAAFDGAWRVDEINIVQLSATLRRTEPAEIRSREAAPVPARGLASLLPQRFELEQVNITQANLGFLGPGNTEMTGLHSSTLKLRPEGNGWLIEGAGGTLSTPLLPVLKVATFRSRVQRGAFFLTDARLQLGETGKISASGEFAEKSSLRLEWEQLDISQLEPAPWKERLTGLFSGAGTVEWSESGGPASLTTSGNFLLTDALLERLPIQEQIATFTGSPQFRRMPLQQVSGDYSYSGGGILITNFVAESKGLLRVEGDCKIGTGGTIAGQFQVGVTPQTLQWLPGSRERVFTVARDGYLWTTMQVGGTLQDMREDLSSRLARAMGEEIIQRGADALQNAPEAVREGARGVLDVIRPLVP